MKLVGGVWLEEMILRCLLTLQRLGMMPVAVHAQHAVGGCRLLPIEQHRHINALFQVEMGEEGEDEEAEHKNLVELVSRPLLSN